MKFYETSARKFYKASWKALSGISVKKLKLCAIMGVGFFLLHVEKQTENGLFQCEIKYY